MLLLVCDPMYGLGIPSSFLLASFPEVLALGFFLVFFFFLLVVDFFSVLLLISSSPSLIVLFPPLIAIGSSSSVPLLEVSFSTSFAGSFDGHILMELYGTKLHSSRSLLMAVLLSLSLAGFSYSCSRTLAIS